MGNGGELAVFCGLFMVVLLSCVRRGEGRAEAGALVHIKCLLPTEDKEIYWNRIIKWKILLSLLNQR